MPASTIIVDLAIRYGLQVLGALLILAASALVARWVGTLTDVRLKRTAMEPPMRILIVRAVRLVVFALGIVAALDKFGVQIAPLIAGIGVAGIGVGFALQGVLSNIVAGLTIIVTKPFRVGEYIAVAGVHGEVASIDLPTTVLLHTDHSRVIVPNRKIVGEILHNFGLIRQITVAVSIADAADLGVALGAAREVLARDPRVLKDPAAGVGVTAVSDAGIRVTVDSWVRGADMVDAERDVYRALIDDLRARGIAMGVPRRDIRVLNGTGMAGTGAPHPV
jgi:small conductance mechanosensitive channel